MVIRALAALGGIESFVKTGITVVIKPNICNAYHSYEYASTTNPWVVGTLVKLCLGAGASEVKVLDYPFGGDSKQAYSTSGIAEQVSANGGVMIPISKFKFKETKLPQAVDLKTCAIFDDILNADLIINVPIAKNHGGARLTLGMKNLMGVIQDRQAIHFNLGQRIADINTIVKPQLTIIDAVRILMKNGPTGGNLDDVKTMDTLIASRDIVAADSYAATLFGMTASDLEYLVAGSAMGLGQSDLSQLRIEELVVDG